VFAYYHRDHLGTPLQATDKNGNIVWSARYDPFGRATITTPSGAAAITSNLRLPGQVEDSETGLHYNGRRYYNPDEGRYQTQDPIGLEGGDNLYRYAEGDPVNLADPTGECPWCAAFAVCMASCAVTTAAENAILGQCNNWGATAQDCAVGCAAGMGMGALAAKGWQWLKRAKQAWDNLPCPVNSFPGDTLVHVRPNEAADSDSQAGKTELKPIRDIRVGDEVLAYAEWKEPGHVAGRNNRLGYEKVKDIFTSHREQQLVHLTLDDGSTLTTTAGHPFRTTEGWRNAILLKKGGKLLLKGGEGESDPERTATITDVRTEMENVLVLNLEVANAHTFFVGVGGDLVHNDSCRTGKLARLRELVSDSKLATRIRGWIKQELNSIERGQRKNIRNPPGMDLAHERGREAAKGFDYSHSNLQDRDLHRLQHKYDDYGRANRERPLP